MKYVNLLVLLMCFMCINNKTLGQSRSNRPSLPTVEVQSDKLRTANGWKLDGLGNWISNENAISDTKLTKESSYSVPQNFKWMQFVLLKSNKLDLYALLYETSIYPSSTLPEKRVYYFLMDRSSYLSLASTINNKTGETLLIDSPIFGYMSDTDGTYTSDKLLRLIEKSASNSALSAKYSFAINAQHVDNEDVVRFRLPEQTASLEDSKLHKSYFETGLDDFKQTLLAIDVQEEKDEFNLSSINPNRSTSENPIVDDTIKIEARTKSKQEDFSIAIQDSLSRNGALIGNIPKNDSIAENDSINNNITERQTKETAIVSAPMALFSDIDCWYLNSDDKWVTDNDPDYKFETVGKYEMRSFKYRDKNYILITRFEKYAGSTFYLIAKEEYMNTLNKMGESSIVRFPVVAYAGIGNTLRDMIELSENIIDSPKKEDAIIYKANYMVLQYKLSLAKNISRFFIYYQECSKYGSETSRENCSSKVSNNIEYADEDMLGSDILFNKAYYESTYKNFIDFFQKPIPSDVISKSTKTEDSRDSEIEPR